MAALTAIVATNAGTVSTGTAVSASDTIAQSQLGSSGALLEVINAGGSTDNITISDNGATAAGNQLSGNTLAVSVANGSQKVFRLWNPGNVNPSTGLITVTHSFTTTVTCKLYPVP